jgi:outer membrane protein assembly factor BamB
MKTRKHVSTARRLYLGGCVLALLGMVATAAALDKPAATKAKSGKSVSRTTAKTSATKAGTKASASTKSSSSARAARDKKRLKELEPVGAKERELKRRALRAAAFEATMRAEARRARYFSAISRLDGVMVATESPSGYYIPYGGSGVSYGSGSSGPLVVDAAKAELKTDPEQERDLVRADEFARQGKYELAIGFWQRVLDASTASVMTRDEWKFKGANHTYQKFRSIADEVERSIARLPKQGLKTYRLQVDGNAQATLAAGAGPRREEALSNVVRKYFLSSFGDDAAFELACLSMDRGEFIGASRLLAKILAGYPDPSVPRNEILLRLVVAHSRLGDRKAAEAALAELRKDPPRGSQRLLAVIEADVRSGGRDASTGNGESSTSWPMALGGPTRTGHMQAPAALKSKSNLTEFWSHEIELGFGKPGVKTSNSPGKTTRRLISLDRTSGTMMMAETMGGGIVSYKPYSTVYSGGQPGLYPVSTAAGGVADLIARWRQQGWMPAGQVLLDGRRLYVKTLTNLVCLDTETKKLLWRSLWKNQFELDGLTKKYAQIQALRKAGEPQHPLDVQLFGDLIHQSMSLAGELVLSIEGKPDNAEADRSAGATPRPSTPAYYYGPQVVHRKRNNWLTAYDAKSGKLRWSRRAGDVQKDETGSEVGFLAAPVPYARLLLAPVVNGGEIWLYAMDRDTGKTVWKTNLCDEPSNGAAPWSPVGVAIDGGEAYIATGAGVVFAVDAMSGGVRWAFRYPRVGRANLAFQQRYGYYSGGTQNQILDMEGMDEDVVIPYGRVLVVMASDYHEIFAVDRRTGEFVWDSPLRPNRSDDEDPARYCLGVLGDSFYVGSNRVVRKYKIRGGRLVWERKLENTTGTTPPSLGRGIVTDAAVYVPLKDSVVKLSHDDGRELEQYGVVLRDHQPVGNLASDGQRLFVLGPGQVSALGDIKVRLKTLNERIKQGDIDALLERMDIRGRTKDLKGALEDLRAVMARMKKEKRPVDIPPVLLKAIAGMELPSLDPVATLRVLAEQDDAFRVYPGIDAKGVEERRRLRDVPVRTALLRMLKKGQPGAVTAIVRGSALFAPDLFDVARQAIRKHAGDDDFPALAAAMAGPTASRRLALMGLSRLKQKPVNDVLKKGLTDADETVRLEAAVVLCNRGVRDGLPVMVDLLNSARLTVRTRTASYLRQMTGKTLGYLPYETPGNRIAPVRKWRDWVKAEGESASLRPVSPVRVFFGRTLIANNANNFVEEYDDAGRRTKRIFLSKPTAVAGLPNGHRLVATASELAVVEYDESWKPVGRISTSKYGTPYSVQRLDNGNTLVACYGGFSTTQRLSSISSQGNVLEFDPAGKIVWRFQYAGWIAHAERLANGNTLVSVFQTYSTSTRRRSSFRGGGFGRKLPPTSSGIYRTYTTTSLGLVLEVGPKRNVVRQIRSGVSYPWSATRLANGNTLIADMNGGRVVEIDPKDGIVGRTIGIQMPRSAQRLPNGNTLVTHQGGVSEWDPSGKLVWNRVGSNTFCAVRY